MAGVKKHTTHIDMYTVLIISTGGLSTSQNYVDTIIVTL